MPQTSLTQNVRERAQVIFADHCDRIHRETDRLFSVLLGLQFLAGIVCAVAISPYTWHGRQYAVHMHVWAALLFGSLLSGPAILMTRLAPGTRLTRYVVASSQMLWSGLLIHLTGGRIETHFHIFGSLAFLAFYRDWTVFVPATLLVVVDHAVRGWLWPMSVYGVALASHYRFLEHAGWVVFEDVFLVWSCVRKVGELRQIALTRAELEFTNERVELQVRQRTAELAAQADELRREIDHRVQVQTERERLNRELLEVSHRAGMAEVATGVLHNVGNVLNSVNASTSLIAERLSASKVASVARLSALLDEHAHDLPAFLSGDERGRQVPGYLASLAGVLQEENRGLAAELDSLTKHIDHIKQVVKTQQKYAGCPSAPEPVRLAGAVRDALQMCGGSWDRHGIDVHCDLADLPPLTLDRHKLLQILINLIRNARHAVKARADGERSITLRLQAHRDGARIDVVDTGVGIRRDDLERIFALGFTTRPDGHGIGLHACAVAVQEMGGALTAHSDGPGTGAMFTLLLDGRPREVLA